MDLIVIRTAWQQSATALLPTAVVAQVPVGSAVPEPLPTQCPRASIAKSDSTLKDASAWEWSPDTKVQPPPEYAP